MTAVRTRLLIARHGNTFAPGEAVRRVGVTDLPLVDSGVIQARALGAHLKAQRALPDVIFSATLKRTLQTAEYARQAMQLEHLPIQLLSDFNEIDYGPDENQPEEKVKQRLGGQALLQWDRQAVVPNGWRVDPQAIIEHWKTFSTRLLMHHRGQTILVITSNGIARFAPHLTGDFDAFAKDHGIKIATGALCIFEHHAEHWCCDQWNHRL